MANVFKIYSGDYSKDGYDSGIDDAKEHKPKNKFKFFKAVNPINYVWAFDNAYQSFMGNYDKGYIDGQRVNHQVYNTTNTQGATVNNRSYESHLQMVNQLKERLTALQNKIESLKENYKKQIDAMENASFMDNYITPLRGKYSEFSQIIDTVQSMIDEHKSQIALHEEALEQLIEDGRG
ncbi:MAG: hypothetical protein Q9M36_08465 [Sulfurovum sp.]|nr:hypothetical protein [Sulfurovum sp.]